MCDPLLMYFAVGDCKVIKFLCQANSIDRCGSQTCNAPLQDLNV